MKLYYQKKGLKRYYRRQNNQNGFENIPVKYPLSELKTIGEFEKIRLNKEDLDISQEQRRKELFIYFYLFQTPIDHPRLLRIGDIINLAKGLNSKILFYITPINIQSAYRSIGEEFNCYFSHNIDTVRDYIIKQNGCFLSDTESGKNSFSNDSVICVDYSKSLESEYFFHPESIDEHLNQKGRDIISKKNMKIALKMLK